MNLLVFFQCVARFVPGIPFTIGDITEKSHPARQGSAAKNVDFNLSLNHLDAALRFTLAVTAGRINPTN